VYSAYSNWVNTPVAGTGLVQVSGVQGAVGDSDGANADARFGGTMSGGTVNANSTLFVVDQGNNMIRVVAP
jgi:hypothetical protein